MKSIVEQIRQTIDDAIPLLRSFDENALRARPRPEKWSSIEILGHLVDSAQNNIQRLVRAQHENVPRIIYHQDDWVRIQRYQDYDKEDLIRFWVALNRHLCRILTVMEPAMYAKTCDTGKSTIELHDLAFIARDYLSHLKHHLKQIQTASGSERADRITKS